MLLPWSFTVIYHLAVQPMDAAHRPRTRLRMLRCWLVFLLTLGLVLAGPAQARAPGPQQNIPPAKVRDLQQIRTSKVLRVLVNQSRNSSGEVKGEPVGIEYYRLRALEHYLNARTDDDQQIQLKLIPRAKEQLLGALARGEGDLAAPGELLDPSTVRGVSSSAPILDQVPLMLVGRKGERSFSKVEQLSGRTVALTSASAAGPMIQQVNQQLALRKRPPIKVEWVDSTLAVEDVLEMVQAGIYHLTVVEQPIARRWARVMPRLRLDSRVHLGRRKPCAGMWGVMRRNCWRRSITSCKVTARLTTRMPRSSASTAVSIGCTTRWPAGPPAPGLGAGGAAEAWSGAADRLAQPGCAGLQGVDAQPGCTRHRWCPWPDADHPFGRPARGVSNTATVDGNVQASARYLALIRRKFFASAKINERERMAFVLAAYNLGPERVQAMRAEARRRGLNGNQWFFQTERIAMEQVGMGPVNFVNSVNKYYLAFNRERVTLERVAKR